MNLGEPSRNKFLELIKLYKNFDETTALNNVSLTVSKGEVICLIGPSGCGKSTLLRSINWLTPPDFGTVKLEGKIIGAISKNGKNSENLNSINSIRARIGMVFQQFNVWPHLSVLENVVCAQLVVRVQLSVCMRACVCARVCLCVFASDRERV